MADTPLVSGWLQSNVSGSEGKPTVMTALFGANTKKGSQKVWKKGFWSVGGDNTLKQHAHQNGPVASQFTVEAVTRVSSKQLDVTVRLANGGTGALSFKSASASELKKWYECLSGKKSKKQEDPASDKRPDALAKLEDLRAQFVRLEVEVAAVETCGDEAASRLRAKAEVAQINGRLDKLQFVGVDSVITTDLPDHQKLDAKAKRKALNADLDDLRRRVSLAHAGLTAEPDPPPEDLVPVPEPAPAAAAAA
eukprot:CAMPEP_0198654430 /NCGR_PEP_ID=MMETSP1467-20131203/7709_1 /TAXON_ID=1462469 /ORGANISM="unid. sp., Strain CCMP2135" /LENGTH=250 /DNA_ID=CAMNT_0044390415 /DNA_START=53 /DNA_END=805 /DNA_ORIENTATION=+